MKGGKKTRKGHNKSRRGSLFPSDSSHLLAVSPTRPPRVAGLHKSVSPLPAFPLISSSATRSLQQAGSPLCERVYFRTCDSHFLCSASEASLGTAGAPLILNSLFLFLFLPNPTFPCLPLIGPSRGLRMAGGSFEWIPHWNPFRWLTLEDLHKPRRVHSVLSRTPCTIRCVS